MITEFEDEGEIRTEERKEICYGATLMTTHAYTRKPESPVGKEIYIYTAMDTVSLEDECVTRLQERTRRERTLEASRIQKWTSRIRTSGVPGGHPRHDSRGRRQRRYQEGTR